MDFQGAVSGFCLPIGGYFGSGLRFSRQIAWLSSFEKRGAIPRNPSRWPKQINLNSFLKRQPAPVCPRQIPQQLPVRVNAPFLYLLQHSLETGIAPAHSSAETSDAGIVSCTKGLEKFGLFRNPSSLKVSKKAFRQAFSSTVSCTPPSCTWCISGLI